MIPKEFTRKYGANLSNPVFLKVPDGIEWEICWTKSAGEIWLEKGWKEFVDYYSIAHGHLLVFKYQQTCKLKVKIFDATAVEIDYPSHNTENRSAPVLIEVSSTTSCPSDSSDETTSWTPSSETTSKKQRTHSSEVVGQCSNLPQAQHFQLEVDLCIGTSLVELFDKETLD